MSARCVCFLFVALMLLACGFVLGFAAGRVSFPFDCLTFVCPAL
jgi:hypothetical protein